MHCILTYGVTLLQIFDVRLNKQLNVVSDLDIFSVAGYAMAHDVLVPFTVSGDELEANGDTTDFSGTLNVEFVKVSAFLSEIIDCGDVLYIGDPEFRTPLL